MEKYRSSKRKRSKPDISKSIEKNINLKIRFWLEYNNETFIATGRAILLEKIKELGSITKAAKSMNISYRHAWKLINSMNKNIKLVYTVTGGAQGGGTYLTAEGEKWLRNFKTIKKEVENFSKELINKLQ